MYKAATRSYFRTGRHPSKFNGRSETGPELQRRFVDLVRAGDNGG